jgi:hypothetical protein
MYLTITEIIGVPVTYIFFKTMEEAKEYLASPLP